MSMFCQKCGSEFGGRKRKFCFECRITWIRNKPASKSWIPESHKVRVCKNSLCGKEFYVKRSSRIREHRNANRYCSKVCWGIAYRNNPEFTRNNQPCLCRSCGTTREKLARNALCDLCNKMVADEKIEHIKKLRTKICALCSEIFVRLDGSCALACVECRSKRKEERQIRFDKKCKNCGIMMVAVKRHRQYCSNSCGRYMEKILRRVREDRVFPGVIPIDVFVRARWKCQICNVSTPKTLMGNFKHPRSPTVDHIIPVVHGGKHCMDNVQCACRDCNSRKSGRKEFSSLIEQIEEILDNDIRRHIRLPQRNQIRGDFLWTL